MHEELIKNLRNCSQINSLSLYKRDLMKQAADVIEELSKPHWIPVTKQLPEEIGVYLVFVANVFQKSMTAAGTALWEGQNFVVGDFVTVTHWMPLPEPPKEEA